MILNNHMVLGNVKNNINNYIQFTEIIIILIDHLHIPDLILKLYAFIPFFFIELSLLRPANGTLSS